MVDLASLATMGMENPRVIEFQSSRSQPIEDFELLKGWVFVSCYSEGRASYHGV